MKFTKAFLQILVTLLVLYMITVATRWMSAASDVSVLAGIALLFSTLPLYWYSSKLIWRKHVTNKKEG